MRRKYSDCNYPEDYHNLSDEDKEVMQLWIKNRIVLVAKSLRPSKRLNSYGLKHHMEREIGLYVTNGQAVCKRLDLKHLILMKSIGRIILQ